ncbi:MAG: sortase [Streptosporangiaceae bacterium]|jgi:sortase A
MTLTRPTAAAAAGAAARPARAAKGSDESSMPIEGQRRHSDALRGIGVAVTLLAALMLTFVGYLYFFSGVQEARAQSALYPKLQYELAQGIAPVGATTPGNPVAVLSIPAIGLHNTVVVEGTSPEDLTLGPGLLRDTVLPGQAGISVIFGRRATFGATFGRVPALRAGDLVTAVTSQGVATYEVIGVSSSAKPVPFREYDNTLLLVTADSSLTPSHYVEVEAKLRSSAQQEPGGLPAVGQSEVALGRDPYALIPALGWALLLAATAFAGSYAAGRWARWPAWIATIPVVLAITWNLFQALSALLPNLY